MKKLLLISFIAFLLPSFASAAISIDATSTSIESSSSLITWTHTVGSLSDGLLVVGCAAQGSSGGLMADATAASFNGSAMTKVSDDLNSTVSSRQSGVVFFILKNPTSGVHTVSTTWSSAFSNHTQHCTSISYGGVSQTNPVDATTTFQGATSTATLNITSTITTTANNDWVIAIANNHKTGTPQGLSASQTTRGTGTVTESSPSPETGTYIVSDTNAPITPAGVQTMTFSVTGAATESNWIIDTLAIEPDLSISSASSSILSLPQGTLTVAKGTLSIQ